MATTDKHPPKQHSTNKRVKPPPKSTVMGTAVVKAKGPKTARPGDSGTTSAKTVLAYKTKGMEISENRRKGFIDPSHLTDIKRQRKAKNMT